MNEKSYRSVVKTILWRVVGTVDTIVISWLITREVSIALSIGFVELFTKMVLYYLHERAWDKIKFGRVEKKELQDNQIENKDVEKM